MTVAIWHNPRCSKSRQTLALLEETRRAVEIVRYLETPPSETDIRTALIALDLSAIDLVRTGEKLFKELGLRKTSNADDLIAAMVAHPILIERPVVFFGNKATIGRLPEAVLDLFD